jgi:hypothetical protein
MAVSFLALRASRPLTPRKIPGTHLCWRLNRTQGHSAAGRIRLIEHKMTSTRIEPATFLLVAYSLNPLRYRVPLLCGIFLLLLLVEWD